MPTVKDYIDIIKEIQKLNPDVTIELDSRLEDGKNEESFFCSVGMGELQLPDGYKVEGGYITNNSAFTANPMFFSVNDINEVKAIKTNDISKVKDSGYTEEEEKYLADLAAEEEKKRIDAAAAAAIEAEMKKGGAPGQSSPGSSSPVGGTAPDNTTVNTERGIRRIVKGVKNLYAKYTELYDRIKEKFGYAVERSEKVEEKPINRKEEEKVEKLAVSYNGKVLDDLIVVSNLATKIKNDEYMKTMLQKVTGKSIEDELDADPHALAELMKDIVLLGELHNFVKDDPEYKPEIFDLVGKQMIQYRRTELHVCNRILQQVRYGGVTENKMKFLVDRVNAKGADFKFDTPQKNEPGQGTPGGTPTGGDKPNGGDTPQQDTPEAVTLTLSDETLVELNKKYSELKMNLFNSLGDYEKAFIEEATAEGIEPGDSEFINMINNRAVDKFAILDYYSGLEKLKVDYEDERVTLAAQELYDKLDEYERMFIEDAEAEGLNTDKGIDKNYKFGDFEFNYMLSERTVNKDRIFAYLNGVDAIYNTYKNNIIKLQNEEARINAVRKFYNKEFTEQNVIKPLIDISGGAKQLEEIRKMREEVEKMTSGKAK